MIRSTRQLHADGAVRRLPLPTDEQAPLNSRDDIKRALLETITATAAPASGPAEEPAAARSRTPVRLVALAAGTAAVAVLLVVAGPAAVDQGRAAYAVREFPDGGIEVIVDDELDSERLAATLRAYDIDVVVETEPASPSLVGEVTGLGPLQEQDEGAFEWASPTQGHDGFVIDPARFRGSFYVLETRQAEPGERYATSADAFGPGEVLAGLPCVLDGPLAADRLAGDLEQVGQTPVWNILGHDTPTDDTPRGEVLHANALDAATVEVTVRLHGDTTPHDASHYLTDGSWAPGEEVVCTAEVVARWSSSPQS